MPANRAAARPIRRGWGAARAARRTRRPRSGIAATPIATRPLDTLTSARFTSAFENTVSSTASTARFFHCPFAGSTGPRRRSASSISEPAIAMRTAVSRNGG
jgi:hypothetical protein